MAYVQGAWLAICQRCGSQFLNHQISREWTGLLVCRGAGTRNCYEDRHPQDFVRGKADKQTPPWVSPEPEPFFITTPITRDDL